MCTDWVSVGYSGTGFSLSSRRRVPIQISGHGVVSFERRIGASQGVRDHKSTVDEDYKDGEVCKQEKRFLWER